MILNRQSPLRPPPCAAAQVFALRDDAERFAPEAVCSHAQLTRLFEPVLLIHMQMAEAQLQRWVDNSITYDLWGTEAAEDLAEAAAAGAEEKDEGEDTDAEMRSGTLGSSVHDVLRMLHQSLRSLEPFVCSPPVALVGPSRPGPPATPPINVISPAQPFHWHWPQLARQSVLRLPLDNDTIAHAAWMLTNATYKARTE